MGIFDYFTNKQETKALTPEKANSNEQSALTGVRKDADIFKAYIPDFLYKPPFGMPRKDNTVMFKKLAKNAYVFSIIKTLCDEATSNPWEVRVKEENQDDGEKHEEKVKEITKFLRNPNGNDESFQHILRQLITDLLETDSAVIVKVFNAIGELKQIYSRDASLFLKNTDIYGYMGDRADFVMPVPDGFTGVSMDFGGTPTVTQQQIMKQYSLLYKEQAAYFQYGWTAGSMPVPFGKREIIYMMQMPRSDSIYGTSPISRLYEVILNLIYGADFNLDFYTNNNMPDGAISLLGATPEHIKQFRENMENQYKFTDSLGNKRKKFWKQPIASTEVKFTPFSITSKDMEVLSQQSWFTKILWMCFGVNAEEMGFTEDSNKSTSETQIKAFKRKAIKPLLDVISYHLNTQLLNEFYDNADPSDVPVEFVFDEYDVDEEISKHNLLEQQIRMGIKTPMMVAKELGIDTTELEAEMTKQKEEEQEGMQFESDLNNSLEPQKDDKEKPKEKKKPEEKSEKNPLNEIDNYIDMIGEDISNAIGELNGNELRI